MTDIIANGYRGASFMLGMAFDRLLLPVAIIVALLGAYLIGVQLAEMGIPSGPVPYQL
ncbi:MAG: hypothetical protein R3D53_14005 [Paracoccaceae bacterium]